MGNKRLLVVTQHFYPENFKINDLVLGLIDQGYKVDILCGHPNYPQGEWFDGYDGKNNALQDYYGATIYRAREIPRKGNTALRIFLNYVSWPISSARKAKKLGEKYDAVLCYNTSPVLMIIPAIVAAKHYHCPLITYVLDLWPENLYSVLPIKNKVLRSIAQNVSNRLYRKSNALITMSQAMRNKLIGRIGSDSPCYVIPQHAEDFYSKEIYNSKLASNYTGKSVLLFAGNLSPAQNLDMVIDAIVEAKHKGFENIFFLILGDGMSFESLDAQIKDLEASDCVQLYGSVDAREVPGFASFADGLILALSPSQDLSLTIPGKLATYMASGKPILASVDGAPAEVIAEADCGLISIPGDKDDLVDTLLEFQTLSPSDKKRMGSNAKSYYGTHFERESCVKMIANAVDQSIVNS